MPSKFLIVKTSSLGDVIQALPVACFLKNRFPESKIDWVVEKPYLPLLESFPYVDRVLAVQTRKWRRKLHLGEMGSFIRELRSSAYDVLFDLQGNVKSGAITFFAKADKKVGFGRKSVPEWPNLLVTNRRVDSPQGMHLGDAYLELPRSCFKDFEPFTAKGFSLRIGMEEERELKNILQRIQKRPCLMICPGSRWQNKQLTEDIWHRFLKLVEDALHPSFLFIYGDEKEKCFAKKMEGIFEGSLAIGELKIPLWQRLMGEMDAILSVDSAALHLAGTTGVPVFGIFGPTHANLYSPSNDPHSAFQGSCPYGKTFDRRCPVLRTCATGACIRSISPETLLKKFLLWWSCF